MVREEHWVSSHCEQILNHKREVQIYYFQIWHNLNTVDVVCVWDLVSETCVMHSCAGWWTVFLVNQRYLWSNLEPHSSSKYSVGIMTNLPSLMHCPLYHLKVCRSKFAPEEGVGWLGWCFLHPVVRLCTRVFGEPGRAFEFLGRDSAESWFGYTRSPHIDVFRLFW